MRAYEYQHWPLLAAAEEGRMEDYHRLAKERAATEKVRARAIIDPAAARRTRACLCRSAGVSKLANSAWPAARRGG